MKTLEFNININAPKEKIWKILWENKTYTDWVSVFCEGTYAVSNWNEGDTIHFLTPTGEGMNSIIEKKIDNQYMAFKHISEMKNFEAMPIDDTASEWTGCREIYELIQEENSVQLLVKMDALEKYVDYFNTTFQKALERVKQLSENN
jgi:hypothetical protein